MPECFFSPMKQHPAGHMVLDYKEWARRTRTPQPEPKPHVPVEDRRFNDDPEKYYFLHHTIIEIKLDPTEEFWANQ